MARKGQVAIQESIETNEEFETYLANHARELICLEIYSEFCGYCLATATAIRKGKLEIGGDRIVMAKALADKIVSLGRFYNRSEPTFMFIARGRVVRLFYGSNGIELCNTIAREVEIFKKEEEPRVVRRKGYDITELLPEEKAKLEEERKIAAEETRKLEVIRATTLAARKKRVSERLAKHLTKLNFLLFWPHCHQAHYDLYETTDSLEIQILAKEQYELDDKAIEEVFYLSDVELNEACLHKIRSGPVLVILFKMQDGDTRDFIKLLRYALYEEIPEPKEDVPPEKQLPPIPAYDRYATISRPKREIRRQRYEEAMALMRKEKEEQKRLKAELARIAREQAEERERLKQEKKEEERMARVQAGLPPSPEPEEEEAGEEIEGEGKGEQDEEEEKEEAEPEELPEEVPEETAEEEEEEEEEEHFDSEISIEGEEYIPPPDLLVPGFYAPANELNKANALLYLFPKVVSEIAPIESEFLPPHMLIMFLVDKRHELGEIMSQFPDEVLNMGFFIGDDLSEMEHVAYTIKQYDKMVRPYKHKDRLAIMVSRKRSLPLLQLSSLNPCYISADTASGEKDCLNLFPVGYGDEYIEIDSKEVLAKKEKEAAAAAAAAEPKKVKPKKVKKAAAAPVEVAEGAAVEGEGAAAAEIAPATEGLPVAEAPVGTEEVKAQEA